LLWQFKSIPAIKWRRVEDAFCIVRIQAGSTTARQMFRYTEEKYTLYPSIVTKAVAQSRLERFG
jgi:hypothetical protein